MTGEGGAHTCVCEENARTAALREIKFFFLRAQRTPATRVVLDAVHSTIDLLCDCWVLFSGFCCIGRSQPQNIENCSRAVALEEYEYDSRVVGVVVRDQW